MQRLVASLLVVVAAVSSASADDAAKAKKLWEEGRGLAAKGDYATACGKFEDSYQLDPAIGTRLNLADCYEHRAMTAKAWHLFIAARRELQKINDADRAAYAKDRADKLVHELATVIVHVAEPVPDDLVVTINGSPVGAGAEVKDLADPGTIEVVATGGGKTVTKQVRGAAGEEVTVELAFGGRTEGTPVETPGPGRSKGWVRAAIVVGGVGVVGLAVAGVLAIEAKGENDDALSQHCSNDPSKCDATGISQLNSAGSLADAATAVSIAGVVAVAAGVTLYVVAPRTAERVAVRPIASPHEIGIAVGGRF